MKLYGKLLEVYFFCFDSFEKKRIFVFIFVELIFFKEKDKLF